MKVNIIESDNLFIDREFLTLSLFANRLYIKSNTAVEVNSVILTTFLDGRVISHLFEILSVHPFTLKS